MGTLKVWRFRGTDLAFFLAFLCLSCGGAVTPLRAQTAQPAPPPARSPSADPQSAPAPQTTSAPQPTSAPQSTSAPTAQDSKPASEPTQEMTTHESQTTFKVPVNLVLVRVVVRDGSGHAVPNLKQDDFQLFDSRKPQIVNHFYIDVPALPAQPAPISKSPAAADETTKPAAVALPGRFIALLFDDVHLSMADLVQSRLAAMRYLASVVQPSDRVALFTVSGQDQVDFTDDRDQLRKKLAILIPHEITAADATGSTGCPTMNFYEADLIANHSDTSALALATADALACAFSGDPRMTQAAQNLATSTAYSMASASSILTDYAFRRLLEVVRRISVLPGQRSIVLISPGFLFPQHEVELGELIDKATRANVLINTIDARGLYTADTGQDISQSYSGSITAIGPKSMYYVTAQNMQGDILAELADGTGAVYFRNSNDLDGGFRQAAGAPEVSYLLGFSPIGLKLDGRFHELKVTLTGKQKYSIQARRGYYAPKHSADPAEVAKEQVEEAVFSQEEIHDLPADLHTQYYKTDQSDAEISVLTHVSLNHLQFRKEDGRNKNNLTIVSALFDRNGNFIAGNEKTIELRLRDTTLARLEQTGMTVKSNFGVKPGSYLVRMVVRDSEAASIAAENGMVEIPY
jgi:VWFA-related protein